MKGSSIFHSRKFRADRFGRNAAVGRRLIRLVGVIILFPLLFILIHPATGFGEYHYYLPYYLKNVAYWTGVALKNGSLAGDASVTVAGIDQAGSLIGSEMKTIPPRGQTAFMMKPGEGWVRVTSDKPLMGLAFVAEGSGNALMFDMTLIPELAKILHIPHVAQDATWDTTVYVCNPNDSEIFFYLAFILSDGTVATSARHTIPANGSGAYPLSELVGDVDRSSGSVEITASMGVAAFALYENLKSGVKSYAGISAVAPMVSEYRGNWVDSGNSSNNGPWSMLFTQCGSYVSGTIISIEYGSAEFEGIVDGNSFTFSIIYGDYIVGDGEMTISGDSLIDGTANVPWVSNPIEFSGDLYSGIPINPW